MMNSPRPEVGRTGNHLLNRLAAEDFAPLATALEPVHFSARQVVHRPDDPLTHLLFPVSSLLTSTVGDAPHDGRTVEFLSVGKEGMVGFTALLGVRQSLHHVTCQIPGMCWRLPASLLSERSARFQVVDDLLKRYTAVAYFTAVQSVVCNALHSVEQRVSRWLLAVRARVGEEIPVTQDLLAAMLGVKRPTISLAAHALQRAGLIAYHRGAVRILEPAGLEQLACACYRMTTTAYERLLDR